MTRARHALWVCASCRTPGQDREPRSQRAGGALYRNLQARWQSWADRESVELREVECLSVCPRPCAVALSCEGKYTYVFGDISPLGAESAVLDVASLFLRTEDGFLPREQRPLALRAGILARVPPLTRPRT